LLVFDFLLAEFCAAVLHDYTYPAPPFHQTRAQLHHLRYSLQICLVGFALFASPLPLTVPLAQRR
jgi:hypothetical protein